MGLSSKKTKTTPIVSDWMKPKLEDFSGRVSSFLDSDPHDYVAPASALQSQAFAGAGDLGGWRPYATRAFDMAQDASARAPAAAQATLAGTRSILDDGGVQKYMDPAVQSYIDPALAAYDADAERLYARLQSDAARNQAFGGSRYGVALGDFMAESTRGRAGVEADLRRRAYEQAVQTALAETDRFQNVDLANAGLQTDVSKTNAGLREQAEQRYLQAIGLLGDLSNSYGANDRADLGTMAELGTLQRGIDGEYRNALPTQLQLAGNLYGAIPPEAYIGSRNKTSGGLGILENVLGGLASSINFTPIKLSDRRIKTDVERVGAHGPLGLYRFRFIGKNDPQVGVMADEVAVHAPHALGPVIGGYATVDYGKLGLAHLVEG